MLQQTLEGRRLSRGERQAMGQILEHIEPNAQTLALYRSIAFDLAREHFSGPDSGQVLDWLEDVIKLLQTQSNPSQRPDVAEAHFSPGDDCVRRIAGLLTRERSKVDICVFTITDDRISSAITDAHKRKVAVRIISDDDKATDRGSDIDRLADAGIPVRVDRTPYHMHHKFALFDDSLLLTGSYNWTRSAARNNEENFIVSGDYRFIESYAELFERLWSDFA